MNLRTYQRTVLGFEYVTYHVTRGCFEIAVNPQRGVKHLVGARQVLGEPPGRAMNARRDF